MQIVQKYISHCGSYFIVYLYELFMEHFASVAGGDTPTTERGGEANHTALEITATTRATPKHLLRSIEQAVTAVLLTVW